MDMKYPGWVLKCKEKGTAIHKIGKSFYLYQIASKWDRKLKRAKKITKGYLGKITPQGLKQPQYRINLPTSCKEYGASWFLLENNTTVIERLKIYFPYRWKEIFIFSVCRLMYQSVLKHMELHYQESWLSEVMPDASLSKNIVGKILEEIGRDRETIVEFLKGFICGNENLLIDLSHMFSLSQDMLLTEKGYNSQWDFTPQVNLLFIFSLDQKLPLFYRVLPGNVRDVSSLKSTIVESGLKDVVIIGDKGFYSEGNIKLLEEERLKYILPLKRNNSLIDYRLIKKGTKKVFEGYFRFQKKFIWYYRCGSKKLPVLVFLDENLRVEEEQDYLGRIETHPEEEYTINNFHKKYSTLGTIALLTNLQKIPTPKVFQYFKSRAEIEQMFDTFKNVLKADRSYMRSDYSLEGWIFINYLSLLYYYKIYKRLVEKELLGDFSVLDVLLYLSKYRKVKISTHWVDLEIPKQTRKLIESLGLHIT